MSTQRLACECISIITGNNLNVHQLVNKHSVVFPYNGILFSNKKEQTSNTHNLNESPENYAEWGGKPILKGYILYGSI